MNKPVTLVVSVAVAHQLLQALTTELMRSLHKSCIRCVRLTGMWLHLNAQEVTEDGHNNVV